MPRILIIDDDAAIRYVLRGILEYTGYEVDEAPNGREGLQRYRHAPADLVITDMCMPGKDGLETIQALRCDFPQVKIIAMSGSRRYLDALQQLGIQSMLQKPFDPLELLAAVRAVDFDCNFSFTA